MAALTLRCRLLTNFCRTWSGGCMAWTMRIHRRTWPVQLVVYNVVYRYNHIQYMSETKICRHAVRTGCLASHGKGTAKVPWQQRNKKRAPVVHCLWIQLHSRPHLLAPLCFQPHFRRRLLLPLRQLCQLCCSSPLPHQQCCCQLHECRPDCQQDRQMMHDFLVSESQRSATYDLLPHSPFSRAVRPRQIFCLASWTQPDSFHPVVGRPASAQTFF